MKESILWIIAISVVLLTSGIFPHIAVMITAISILLIAKFFK